MHRTAFDHAYDELRVGPVDGSPLVLLPGGLATGLVWYANAPALSQHHRVHAADLMGDAGRSERRGTPLKSAGDLTAWLDALLDGLGLARTHLCGHSYGAWLAVRYALHAPQRVTRLALVDPTQVFAGFRPSYLLRALPTLIRPSQDRARSFLAWETAPTRPDETWQRLYALAATVPSRRLIAGGQPPAADLRMPTLVLLAEHSRAHNARHIADRARRALPQAEVSVLPGATTTPCHSPDRKSSTAGWWTSSADPAPCVPWPVSYVVGAANRPAVDAHPGHAGRRRPARLVCVGPREQLPFRRRTRRATCPKSRDRRLREQGTDTRQASENASRRSGDGRAE